MAFNLNPIPKQGDTRLIAYKKVLMRIQTSATSPSAGNNSKQADTLRQTVRKILKAQANLP